MKKTDITRNKRNIKILLNFSVPLVILMISLPGCKKFVQIDPPETSITSPSVYASNGSAQSVLTGLYSKIAADGNFSGGVSSIGYNCGIAADELQNYKAGSIFSIFYTNSYTSSNINAFWSSIYQKIYICNAAIEGILNSSTIRSSVKSQLVGEAKFIRAFMYFYATNLFGDVPLTVTTNYQINNTISRSPQIEIYQQITSDLLDAHNLLSDNFVDATGATTSERTRPNKEAANALLARVYLYQKLWDKAEAAATEVISDSGVYSLDALDNVFLKNSQEAIWQLQPVIPGSNGGDGSAYVITSKPGTGNKNVSLSSQILSVFEPGDNRLISWVGIYTDPQTNQKYYYPFKYKVYLFNQTVSEYTMILRLAEQYLIRAEARTQQGNLSGAISDLNAIRNRAGLPNTTVTTQADLLAAIQHERQAELFTEWGDRWFDLKRSGNINSIMSIVAPQKGGTWADYKALLPIPRSEIQLNSNLTQNVGY